MKYIEDVKSDQFEIPIGDKVIIGNPARKLR